MPSDSVRFGPFELRPVARELFKHGVRIRVQDKPLELLAALIESRGEVVSREALIQRLWGDGTFVDFEQSLNKAVNKLREALGDSASAPRYVETVARRGYRFLADVETPAAVATAAASLPDAAPATRTSRALLLRPGFWAILIVAVAVTGWFFWPERLPRVTRIRQVTFDGYRKQPLVLLDNNRLLFLEFRDDRWALAEVSAEGSDSRLIPLKGVDPKLTIALLDHSSSRQELLVSAASKPEDSAWDLLLVSLTEGSARRLGPMEFGQSGQFSPDGTRIVLSTTRGLDLIQTATGERTTIYRTASRLWNPVWSPDQKQIVFALADSNAAIRLWTIPPDGSGLARLLPDVSGEQFYGRWNRTGTRFFLFGGQDSWVMSDPRRWRLPGQQTGERLTRGPFYYSAPAIGMDNRTLYVAGGQPRGEVVRYNAAKKAFEPLPFRLSADGVEYSPDGKWIVYVSFPQGTLWRARADGSEKLALAPQIPAYLPRWSPDGTRIAFMGRPDDRTKPVKIYSIRADGSGLAQVTAGVSAEGDPNWSPDGKRIVFAPLPGDSRAGEQHVSIFDFGTAAITQVPGSDGLFSPRWSPDGRYLAAMSVADQHLMLYDFSAGMWRTLAAETWGFPSWTKDGRYIYGINGARRILRVEVETGRLDPHINISGFPTAGNLAAWWMGLDAAGTPMVLRDESAQEIYAIELDRP